MKRISYLKLQEKYPKKIVALDKKEEKVLAAGNKFMEIFKKLQKSRINIHNAVFVGPIQKKGTVNVYFSLNNDKKRTEIEPLFSV